MAGRSSPSMNPMSWLQVQRTRSVSKKLVSRPVVNAVKKTKQTLSAGKRRDLVGALIISFFAVRPSVTSFYFVISHNSDPLANPSIFLVCLIIYGN